MKPTFALNLSNDSVGLLHRTPRGWLSVGEVAFSDPDLPEALSYLRATGLGLSPRGITTKLVIPNSQILYTEVEAPGPDAASRRRQIKAALKGRTPYEVDELVFDWWGKGQVVQVAVIARETLDEAESFAVENRFNPVSFVAIPDEGTFKGEPWFGVTKASASILAPGEKVERDQDSIQITPREVPKAEPVVQAAEAAPVPEVAPVVDPEPAPEPVAPPPPAEEPVAPPVELPPEPEMEPEPETPDEVPSFSAFNRTSAEEVSWIAPKPPVSAEPPVAAPPVPAPAPQVAERAPASKPAVPPAPVSAAAAPAAPARPPAPPADEGRGLMFGRPSRGEPAAQVARPAAARPLAAPLAQEPADEAPMALNVTDDLSIPRIDDLAEDDLPPPPSPAAMAAFASRRVAEPPPLSRPLASPVQGKSPTLGSPSARPVVERPAMAKPAPVRIPADAPPRVDAAATGTTTPAASTGSRTLKGLGALVTAPSIPGSRKRKADATVVPASAPIPTTPAQTPPPPPLNAAKSSKAPANAFGTRPPMQVRGKPRYLGLILTGLLLLFLALVAAWSTYYIASSNAPATTDVAATEAAPAADTPVPTAEELAALSAAEAEADGQDIDPADLDVTGQADADAAPSDPATPAPAQPEAVAVDDAASESTVTASTSDPVVDAAEPAAPPAAETTTVAATPEPAAVEPAPDTVVGTEAATVAQPNPEQQDEIFLAAMDAPPNPVDPVALTAPSARGDPLPAAQMPPPPFGTVYQFDADGMIVPTPEGIITPEGVRLVAGPPARVPPERPASLVVPAAALVAPDPVAASTAAVPAIDTFMANPELAGARPRLRPENLVPPASQQGAVDPSLALPADSRFASLRPQERPAAIEDAGEQARLASAAASLANEPASPLAVSVSRVPAARPKDMSRAVEAAVALAARLPDPVAEPEPVALAQPAPEPEPQPAAKPQKPVEPEAEEEPEVASNDRSPELHGTVAKKATYVNAINLSKLNLIGVYGTPSKRYALVRLASGRYKKVKVGDSVDGGRIAAISATEVSYQKGGKMQKLAMPKGTD